jgi:carbonic anhydrase
MNLNLNRLYIYFLLILLPVSIFGMCEQSDTSENPEMRKSCAADESLKKLLKGNKRFASERSKHPNLDTPYRLTLVDSQNPFALILSCADSRVPPELIFDQGLGNLFTVRVAGNILDSQAVLGSIEYGVAVLKIPLIMVLGHESCGAVHAAIEVEEGHATCVEHICFITDAIEPAVKKAQNQSGDLLENSIIENIKLVIKQLKKNHIVEHAIKNGKLKIVGADYNFNNFLVSLVE